MEIGVISNVGEAGYLWYVIGYNIIKYVTINLEICIRK